VKWPAAICVMGAVCLPASASPSFKSGNELYITCKSDNDFAKGICTGYIIGAVDVLIAPIYGLSKNRLMIVHKARICLRDGVTVGQATDVVIRWLDDNPAQRDASASSLVELALASNGFKC